MTDRYLKIARIIEEVINDPYLMEVVLETLGINDEFKEK